MRELKIGSYHLSVEFRPQEPGNYLLGGFAKYYSDKRHPNYDEIKAEDIPPVKMLQTRIDLFTVMVEVILSNVKRERTGR